MPNHALLNNIEHADLKVRRGVDAGDRVNQVLVFPTEFGEVQREFPIFFRRDAAGAFQAVALLGLEKNENLFLGEDGWQSRYVPAIQERGPFLIGLQEQKLQGETHREPMVLVDLEHPRVNKTEGEPLFLAQGGNAPYLERIAHILRVIHQGAEIAKDMFAAFEQADLIEALNVEVKLSDAEQINLPGLHTISAPRLAALDGAVLEMLNKAGFLQAAFHVLASLPNVSRLIDIKNRNRARR